MKRALLSVLVMGLAAQAQARPAVVRVFETQARATPSKSGEAVAVFIEGQRISVAETSEQGWRRVRLGDGATAWVEDSALFLDAQLPEGAAKPGTTPVVPASAPGITTPVIPIAPPVEHPFIIVNDLEGLREAVATEPPLVERVDALAVEDRKSRWIFFGGLTAGILTAAVPLTINSLNDEHTSGGWMYGGGAILLATQIAAWAYAVGEEDVAPVVDTWNTGHPKTPLQYDEE